MKENTTKAWQEYEIGKNYKTRINLYNEVDLCYRFYLNDQWVGVESGGLPLLVFNFIKRVANSLIPKIGSRNIAVKFTPNVVGMTKDDISKDIDVMQTALLAIYGEENPQVSPEELRLVAKFFTYFHDQTAERLNMNYIDMDGLFSAYITGDYINYFYWDDDIETGQNSTGDVNVLTLDNTNVYYGNPNEKNVQKQPYIIILQRENIAFLKEQAKANGAAEIEINSIVSDSDTQYDAGDMSKIELDDNSKCITLLKLYKKKVNGKTKLFAEKSTKGCVIRKEWDTKLPIYPLAHMNWTTRKNCIYGQSEVSGLIPNQIAVNRILTMDTVSTMNTAYPKTLYDNNAIEEGQISNAVGATIGIDANGQPLSSFIDYLDTPQNTGAGLRLATYIVDATKEAMGANEVMLGNANSDNTSALTLNLQQSSVSLEIIQQRLYKMREDEAKILMHFWLNYYTTERQLKIADKSGTYYVPFAGNRYKDYLFDLKIEVGQSQVWSEAMQEQRVKTAMQYGKLPAHIAIKFGSDFEGKDEFTTLAKEAYDQEQALMMQKTKPQQLPEQTTI